MRISILAVLLFCSTVIYGQKTQELTSETMKFYFTEWVIEFPDTLLVYMENESLPKLTRYSVIVKKGKYLYNFACWTGKPALESPTQSIEKFKVKFKNDQVTFKLGKTKNIYIINRVGSQLMLIKREK